MTQITKISVLVFICVITVSVVYSQSTYNPYPLCKECPAEIQVNKVSEKKKLDSLIYQEFDKKQNIWVTALKASFSYTPDHKISDEKLSYYTGRFGSCSKLDWGTPGSSQHTFKYDKKFRLTEESFQYSDSIGNLMSETEDASAPGMSMIPVKVKPKGSYQNIDETSWYVVPKQIINGGYRATYSYNPENKLTTLLYEEQRENNFVNYSRITYAYDKSEKISEEVLYFYDSEKTNWRAYKKLNYKYDSKGIKTNEIYTQQYEPDSAKQWTLIPIQILYSYDEKGRLTKEVFQQNIEGNWSDYHQIIHTLNIKGGATEILTQTADGGSWYNSSRLTNTFDSKNNLVSTLCEEPNFEEWKSKYTETYTYDEQGNKLTYVSKPAIVPDYVILIRCNYYYSNK
jgi:NAD-dependent SIR2 family protein deacetylase